MTRTQPVWLALATTALLAIVPAVQAQQPKNPPKGTPPRLSTTKPSTDPKGPVIERVNPRDLTLKAFVTLRLQKWDTWYRINSTQPFAFESAALVFPIVSESASSQLAYGNDGARFTLKVDGQEIKQLNTDGTERTTLDVVDNAPPGTRYGRMFFGKQLGARIELEVVTRSLNASTLYNEAAAATLKMPATWPEPAATFLTRPQWGVDLGPDGRIDMQPVREFAERITKDPRNAKQPPSVIAKMLAGEVVKAIQVTSSPVRMARTGAEIEGFNLGNAAATLAAGRGTEFDLVALLTAVYRQAGIPARTVIGFKWANAKDKDRLFSRSGAAGLVAWTEFALLDDRAGEGKLVWVPVDIADLRRSSSRPPPIERPWDNFGTVPMLEAIVPMGFDFHPPIETVAYGSPALFGWIVSPSAPTDVVQVLRFDVDATPKRGSNTTDAFTPPAERPGQRPPPPKSRTP